MLLQFLSYFGWKNKQFIEWICRAQFLLWSPSEGRSQILLLFVRVIQGVGLPMVALESFSLALPFSFVITLQMVNKKGKRIDSSKWYNFQLRIIGSSEIRVWRYSSKTTSDHVDGRDLKFRDARACQGLGEKGVNIFRFRGAWEWSLWNGPWGTRKEDLFWLV